MSLQAVLNQDILLAVLEASSDQQVCLLMRTCRYFYDAGPRVLLRTTVRLHSETCLHQFLTFLRVQPERRFKLVRSLNLTFSELPESAALQLAQVLPLMVNLRSLSLKTGDFVLGSRPSLVAAFAALTSLQELRLWHVGEVSIKMLQNLQSRLVRVTLVLNGGDEPVLPEHHPAVLLAHSMGTLEVIEARGLRTHDQTSPDPDLVYPEMRRLDFESTGMPLTMTFINAYPNLTHLSYSCKEGNITRFALERREVYEAQHRLNIREQINARRTWNGLQQFVGSLSDLYLLGLTCPVDDVTLHDLEEVIPDMLETMLGYARPQSLKLGRCSGTQLSLPTGGVCGALAAGSSRLESLTVTVGLQENEAHVDIGRAMDGLLLSLGLSPLRNVEITVHTGSLDPRSSADRSMMRYACRRGPPPPGHGVDNYPLNFAELSAVGFNAEDYLRRFSQTIPSLRHARVCVIGPRERYRVAVLDEGQISCEAWHLRSYRYH
ncbi:hypothetical protein BV20DRAFT_1039451 [Pilatotrama ljubarskyi]|nr:hypothetical protein BV20DRAFT_1039451 [Pilatotrama ljubarskyi]